MSNYFIITTNREVATQIEKQCAFDAKMEDRSYKLGQINHHERFSDVQILAKNDKILPQDLFWLGHFSAINHNHVCTCGSDIHGYGFAKCFSCGKLKDL
jgi:hypothetical protein